MLLVVCSCSSRLLSFHGEYSAGSQLDVLDAITRLFLLCKSEHAIYKYSFRRESLPRPDQESNLQRDITKPLRNLVYELECAIFKLTASKLTFFSAFKPTYRPTDRPTDQEKVQSVSGTHTGNGL